MRLGAAPATVIDGEALVRREAGVSTGAGLTPVSDDEQAPSEGVTRFRFRA
jgi:hypothetical protein